MYPAVHLITYFLEWCKVINLYIYKVFLLESEKVLQKEFVFGLSMSH